MTSFYLNNSLIESPLLILRIASENTSATDITSSLSNSLSLSMLIVSLTIILSIGASLNKNDLRISTSYTDYLGDELSQANGDKDFLSVAVSYAF